ncbi:MAG: hypothetical protein KTR24_09685 [Saprospiraceae bacterium]|nr:hypothetical protein [Saprospiraceae bacterium]
MQKMLVCVTDGMDIFLCFLIAMGFSGLGALPVGLINLSLANWTIRKGRRAGLVATIGAILVEFGYTFLAVYFIDFFSTNETVELYIKIFSVFVFSALAVYYFLKTKNKQDLAQQVKSGQSSKSFWFGIGITGVNLLIIPYWIFIAIWLRSNGYGIASLNEILWISTGSALGAGLVFLIYVQLGTVIVGKVSKVNEYTNRVLTVLFAILAVIQVIRIFA